ncbi:MAG TPA: ferrochelatase [Bdellovibrionales bacterium]|nr:ferrochelatase [Bdellovibrionales bacterium]
MAERGLLLVNLGSPDAPEAKSVARYLREFLNDPYVIDLKTPWRQMLVHLVIAPFRAKKSAHAYRQVWRDEGSPLIHFSREFADKAGERLKDRFAVRWAMRYGRPSIKDVLKDWDIDELVLVPMYPQYAESSSRTAIEAVKSALDPKIELKVIEDFFADPEFIRAETTVIQRELDRVKPDLLLLSFHGLPEHHLTKLHPAHCLKRANCCDEITDRNRYCYRAQCFATMRSLKQNLIFAPEKISISFQSRLGRRPWIKPYTDFEISKSAANGVRKLAVACPSFVADCLETLEEVEMRLSEQFIKEGGESLTLIPSLNAEPEWVTQFSSMVLRRVESEK